MIPVGTRCVIVGLRPMPDGQDAQLVRILNGTFCVVRSLECQHPDLRSGPARRGHYVEAEKGPFRDLWINRNCLVPLPPDDEARRLFGAKPVEAELRRADGTLVGELHDVRIKHLASVLRGTGGER